MGIAWVQKPGAIRIKNFQYQIQHAAHNVFHALTGQTDLGNPIQNIQKTKAMSKVVRYLMVVIHAEAKMF